MYSAARPLPRVRLSNKEKGLYSNLFSRADSEGSNKVEGRTAVEFFKKSGLPVDRLKEIWNLAAPSGESYLDRERFYVAVRLIALAQAGKSMTLEAIEQNVEVDLPQFSGFGGADKPESDSYDLSTEEKSRYEQIFASSAGPKGSLTGLEARSLFERTGVDIGALSKIWTLADPQDTGLLTKSQFVVAMHLIAKVKQRYRVPDQLPASLVALIAARSLPSGSPQGEGLVDIGGFGEKALSFPKPAVDRSPLTSAQPVLSFPAPEMRSVTPPPVPRPPDLFQSKPPDLYQSKPTELYQSKPPDLYQSKPVLNDDPFSALPKAEIRRDPPPRPAEEPAAKDYFSTLPSKPSTQKEDRRPSDDPALRDLQRALKAMELQVEELTEELRSTKKEVRTTREASGQELEDFAKEMRKQRDSMERQIEEFTKELRTERRSATETCESTRLAAKLVSEAVGGLGVVKVQCEDSLKQGQLLAAQMQTALQQITAQHSKLMATVVESVQKQTAEIAAFARDQRPEARRLPEHRVEPAKAVGERTQELPRVPAQIEPVKAQESPAPAVAKEPIRPPEPKRAPIPPEPIKPAEPFRPMPDPVQVKPLPLPEVRPLPPADPIRTDISSFRLPKLEERKEPSKSDDIDWPEADSKSFPVLSSDPPKKEEDFEFEIEPKVITPIEAFNPAVQFRPPEFSMKETHIADLGFGFPAKDAAKGEEMEKSDLKPDFAAFSLDFPGLPVKPEASIKAKEETAVKPDKSAAPSKEGDFGDFKAFDAFTPGFSANFSSGVFNFDTSSVQLKKSVFDL